MPKFGDYSAVTTLADTDVIVFSTATGTKKITVKDLANFILSKYLKYDEESGQIYVDT